MAVNSDFSYVIIGAGAAGLWLADALLQSGLLTHNTLCIVESDEIKTNDRTWCYWAKTPLAPLEMVSKTWEQTLNPGQLDNMSNLAPYKYFHVRSEDFYRSIKHRLLKNPNVCFKTDTVLSVQQQGQTAMVKTQTATWQSNYVFTSVDFPLALPPQQKKNDNLFLLQSFVGWRIKTERPVFDEAQLTLMRFDIAQSGNTQFLYLLPYSATEALVEITRFGEKNLPYGLAETILHDFLQSQQIGYQTLETEIGAIPMTPDFDVFNKFHAAQERIISIGTIGGAIKPSTGYGFTRMHAHGMAIAEAIKTNSTLPTLHRNWRFRMYDILLLRILKHRPEEGSIIFMRLFKTQPIQRVFRFLDEKTSIWEEVQIFSKLPIFLFLKSLFNNFK